MAQVAAAAMPLTAEAYDTAAVQTVLVVLCARRARAATPTDVTEPGVLDVVPLGVATGNVRAYFTALSYSHRVVVTLKQWPLPCEARQMVVNLRGRSADASRIVQARLPIWAGIVTQFVTHFWWTSSLGPSHVAIAGVGRDAK